MVTLYWHLYRRRSTGQVQAICLRKGNNPVFSWRQPMTRMFSLHRVTQGRGCGDSPFKFFPRKIRVDFPGERQLRQNPAANLRGVLIARSLSTRGRHWYRYSMERRVSVQHFIGTWMARWAYCGGPRGLPKYQRKAGKLTTPRIVGVNACDIVYQIYLRT